MATLGADIHSPLTSDAFEAIGEAVIAGTPDEAPAKGATGIAYGELPAGASPEGPAEARDIFGADVEREALLACQGMGDEDTAQAAPGGHDPGSPAAGEVAQPVPSGLVGPESLAPTPAESPRPEARKSRFGANKGRGKTLAQGTLDNGAHPEAIPQVLFNGCAPLEAKPGQGNLPFAGAVATAGDQAEKRSRKASRYLVRLPNPEAGQVGAKQAEPKEPESQGLAPQAKGAPTKGKKPDKAVTKKAQAGSALKADALSAQAPGQDEPKKARAKKLGPKVAGGVKAGAKTTEPTKPETASPAPKKGVAKKLDAKVAGGVKAGAKTPEPANKAETKGTQAKDKAPKPAKGQAKPERAKPGGGKAPKAEKPAKATKEADTKANAWPRRPKAKADKSES
jgi:hypothetical protein